MTTCLGGSNLKLRGRVWLILCLMLGVMSQAACTRDDVAAAVQTVSANLEATLVPWGATTVADAQMAYATAKAPVTPAASRVEEVAALDELLKVAPPAEPTKLPPTAEPTTEPTPMPPTATVAPTETSEPTATATETPEPTAEPTETATPAPTETPPPTPTPQPTETPTAEPTAAPTATATPLPVRIAVAGGEMVLIPGGTFFMGAAADTLAAECNQFRQGCQTAWFAASEPIHVVLLRRYYIDIHEVTSQSFVSFLNGNGGECLGQPCLDAEQSQISAQGDEYVVAAEASSNPATGVTWYGAAAFCEWRGGRLPTEAEWEKAAVWDVDAKVAYRYPWGDTFDGRLANFCDESCDEPQANSAFGDGYPQLAPVASYEDGRSPYGLYDMGGNVWEWVADWFDPVYYASSAGADPMGPDDGEAKVVRGGSWFDTGNYMASAIRFPSPPDNADRTIGFRCAADVGMAGNPTD